MRGGGIWLIAILAAAADVRASAPRGPANQQELDAMTLWVANDLNQALPGATVEWSVTAGGQIRLSGRQNINVPAVGAAPGEQVDLPPVTSAHPSFDLELKLIDAEGRDVSRYRRTVRVVPAELRKAVKPAATADPFNKKP